MVFGCDGSLRSLDFVLAYSDGGDEEAALKRKTFLTNLESEGVNIELEPPGVSDHGRRHG